MKKLILTGVVALGCSLSLAAATVPPPGGTVEAWQEANSVHQSGSGSGRFVGGVTPSPRARLDVRDSVIQRLLSTLDIEETCVFEAIPDGAYFTNSSGTVEVGFIDVVPMTDVCSDREIVTEVTIRDAGIQWAPDTLDALTTIDTGAELARTVSTSSSGRLVAEVRQTVPFHSDSGGFHGLGSELSWSFRVTVLDDGELESMDCYQGQVHQTHVTSIAFEPATCRA